MKYKVGDKVKIIGEIVNVNKELNWPYTVQFISGLLSSLADKDLEPIEESKMKKKWYYVELFTTDPEIIIDAHKGELVGNIKMYEASKPKEECNCDLSGPGAKDCPKHPIACFDCYTQNVGLGHECEPKSATRPKLPEKLEVGDFKDTAIGDLIDNQNSLIDYLGEDK